MGIQPDILHRNIPQLSASGKASPYLWKHFIRYYEQAYDVALRNAMKRQQIKE